MGGPCGTMLSALRSRSLARHATQAISAGADIAAHSRSGRSSAIERGLVPTHRKVTSWQQEQDFEEASVRDARSTTSVSEWPPPQQQLLSVGAVQPDPQQLAAPPEPAPQHAAFAPAPRHWYTGRPASANGTSVTAIAR